jgi:hypothetical protein
MVSACLLAIYWKLTLAGIDLQRVRAKFDDLAGAFGFGFIGLGLYFMFVI